jgi:hypothetical protein
MQSNHSLAPGRKSAWILKANGSDCASVGILGIGIKNVY